MGGYIKKYCDALAEEAVLLNKHFCSSKASASGEEGQEDCGSGQSRPEERCDYSSFVQDGINESKTRCEEMEPEEDILEEKVRIKRVESIEPNDQQTELGGKDIRGDQSPAEDLESTKHRDQKQSTHNLDDSSIEVNRNGPPVDTVESRSPSSHNNAHPTTAFSNETIQESSPSTSSATSNGFDPSRKKQRKDRTGHPKLDQVAVNYLRGWLLSRQHIERPYPTEGTYARMGAATGLGEKQIKNWFVNNRRRLWRPVMDEIRKTHGLSEREPLPPSVLATLEDEPTPPYGPAAAAADSDAAAAMILLTGSRAVSPTISTTFSTSLDKGFGCADADRDTVKDILDELIKQVECNEIAPLMATSSTEQVAGKRPASFRNGPYGSREEIEMEPSLECGKLEFSLSKEQIKFNANGNVVLGAAPLPNAVASTVSFRPIAGSPPCRDERSVPQAAAAAEPMPSPLDLLSSAVLFSQEASTAPKGGSLALPTRKAVCGKCEACMREDCGQCKACLDKPKFGGPNKLRKKCLTRKCPNMSPLSFLPGPRPSGGVAPGQLERSSVPERKVATPNLAVMAAERRWSENLEFLRPCIEGGGFINYSAIEEEETRNRVKNFVKEQRKQYRRREDGEPSSLTDERVELLEGVGFPWVFRPYIKLRPAVEEKLTSAAVASSDQPAEQPAESAIHAALKPTKPVTSPWDLLCSITSQSFSQTSSWHDTTSDNEDNSGESGSPTPSSFPAVTPPTPTLLDPDQGPCPDQSTSGSSKLKYHRSRGLNCGKCDACLLNDCGECRECLDKPKFGGLNTLKRRCSNRRCLNREETAEDKPATVEEKKSHASKAIEEAMMKAELAKIKAELDAKAGRVKYGLGSGVKRGLNRNLNNLMREVEAEESDNESDITQSDIEHEIMELAEAPSEELCNAVYETALAAGMLNLPRGVTMRPSGKWQVQIYYAGNTRYIGLFDSQEEAAAAYAIARGCCDSFEEEDQNPCLVTRNLNLMRRAAFSGEAYKTWRPPVLPEMREERSDDDMEAELGSVKAKLDAKAQGTECYGLGNKPPFKTQGTAVEKPHRANPTADDLAKDEAISTVSASGKKRKPAPSLWTIMEMEEEERSRKRKFSSEIYEKARALAASLPRGITVRPSGKWQVQLYYAGKSRYIGVFDSKLDAAVAYELARECCSKFKDDDTSPDEAKRNVILMRQAAFSFTQNNNKKKKISSHCPPGATLGGGTGDNRKKRCAVSKQAHNKRTSEHSAPWKEQAERNKGALSASMPTKPKIDLESKKRPTFAENMKVKQALVPPTHLHDLSSGISSVARAEEANLPGVAKFGNITPLPEIGPGWKLSMVPRKSGEKYDYYYFSPTNERFRSLKEAKDSVSSECDAQGDDQTSRYCQLPSTSDQERRHDEQSSFSNLNVGAVGYKFRKNFADESGNSLGWFDGEVVDILAGTDNDRRCLYNADGYIEDLNLAELMELRELESKSHVEFGSVGYKFQKQFPDGKWYDGAVVKILEETENGNSRRCHYPAGDDFEDLSIADLQKLAELEKNKEEEKEKQEEEQDCMGGNVEKEVKEEVVHNDLCETCGLGGKLLCCSTCNLVFHLSCTRPKLTKLPADDWSCAFCVASGDAVKNTSKQDQRKAHLAVQEIQELKEEVRKKEKSRRRSPRKRK